MWNALDDLHGEVCFMLILNPITDYIHTPLVSQVAGVTENQFTSSQRLRHALIFQGFRYSNQPKSRSDGKRNFGHVNMRRL